MKNLINFLVVDGPYSNSDFYNFLSTSQLPRHRWYYFKEGFSNAVIQEAIKEQGKKNLRVLDPFAGSGTTLLTTALSSHYSTGVEVNPFLEFVARVKSSAQKFERDIYKKTLNKIIRDSTDGDVSPLEGFSSFTERADSVKWLFNLSVLRRFTAVIREIEVVNTYKNTFTLAAIVAATKCCNAKRDGKGIRYKKGWENCFYSPADFIKCFRMQALIMLDDVEQCPIASKYEPNIVMGDSRKHIHSLEEEFNLVVTSPPYLNSLDYSDVYRVELFLSQFIKSNQELRNIRLQTLRSHIQVDWDRDIKFDSDLVNSYVDKLERSETLWSKRIPLMVRAYFDDMNVVFKGIREKLKKNGQVWMVVSTSAYGGIHIPVDLLLADIGNNAGFQLKAVHHLRNLRTSSQQYKELGAKKHPLRESLVILSKI